MQIFVCISQMPYEERSKQVMYHISRQGRISIGGNERGIYQPIQLRHRLIMRLSTTNVIEWLTKYISVISQNALSLILAPPSGENSGQQQIIAFFATSEQFSAMFRPPKMHLFRPKKNNNNPYSFSRDLAARAPMPEMSPVYNITLLDRKQKQLIF